MNNIRGRATALYPDFAGDETYKATGVKAAFVSSAGSATKPNEDQFNFIFKNFDGCAAMVTDGATGLGDRHYVAETFRGKNGSDASIYARELTIQLSERLSHEFAEQRRALNRNETPVPADAAAIAKDAIANTALTFRQQGYDLATPSYAQPSAAAVWFMFTPHNRMLTWAGLADCAMLHQTPDGKVTRMPTSWDRIRPDAYLEPLLKAHKMVAPEATDAERRADILPFLRRARSRMNQPNGYWIYSLEPEAARHQCMGQQVLEKGEHKIMLMSDGFDRLGSFGLYNDAKLIQAAAQPNGLEKLYAELRTAEDADPACTRHKRTKKSDDATAVLASFKVS